jgi:hypothetical protein
LGRLAGDERRDPRGPRWLDHLHFPLVVCHAGQPPAGLRRGPLPLRLPGGHRSRAGLDGASRPRDRHRHGLDLLRAKPQWQPHHRLRRHVRRLDRHAAPPGSELLRRQGEHHDSPDGAGRPPGRDTVVLRPLPGCRARQAPPGARGNGDRGHPERGGGGRGHHRRALGPEGRPHHRPEQAHDSLPGHG